MLRKQSALRVAAATVATAFAVVGAAGPSYATGHGSKPDHANATHAAKGPAMSHAEAGPDRASGGDRHSDAPKSEAAKSHGAKAGTSQGGRSDNGKETNPPGHQAVTVCHLLGNGSYHLLTFDDHALDAHRAHGDLYPVPAGGCPATAPGPDHTTGHEHARVTVCHVLGNVSYHLLTFDQHALKAHLGHGDLYPVPADGCPAAVVPGTVTPGTVTPSTVVPGQPGTVVPPVGTVPGTVPGAGTEVPGVHQQASVQQGGAAQQAAQVLGVQAVRAADRAPARVAPAAGILPQTGAPRIALLLSAGLGLLAAGAGLLARRRAHGNA